MPETLTKERPILFSDELVRAIQQGRKTQTRRPVKDQCADDQYALNNGVLVRWAPTGFEQTKAKFSTGDRLWVREAWRLSYRPYSGNYAIEYRADTSWQTAVAMPLDDRTSQLIDRSEWGEVTGGRRVTRWKSSIHMPRWASRITLKVTDVRVERLQDISDEDAKAEGIEPHMVDSGGQDPSGQGIDVPDYLTPLFDEWTRMYPHGPCSWGNNPWVWVVEFRRLNP